MPLADPAALEDEQRLEHLHRILQSSRAAETTFSRILSLTQSVIDAPAYFVSLVDAKRHIIAAQQGLDGSRIEREELPLTHSFCQHVVASGDRLVVEDSQLHPLVFDNLAVGEFNIMAYAGMPLKLSDGYVMGSLYVIDHEPRRWAAEELALLDNLAHIVTTELELRDQIATTERAQQALRESRRFVDEIVHAVPDTIYVYDIPQDRVVFTNRDIGAVLGYNEAWAERFTTDELAHTLVELMHPDERQAVLSLREQLFASRGESEATEIEMRLKTADGSWQWFSSREAIFERDERGKPVKMLGVIHDISQRKEADAAQKEQVMRQTMLRRIEAELSRSLEMDSVLTVAMDAALRTSRASDGFIGLLEGDSVRVAANSGGYPLGARYYAEEGIMGRALRTRKPEFVLDVTKDPDYVQHIPHTRAQIAIPLVYRDRVIGVIVLETAAPHHFTTEAFEFLKLIIARVSISLENARLFEITEANLKEMEALYARVRGLEQMKTDMIRIAAHDLRNPLGVITGFSQLMLDDSNSLSTANKDIVETILRSAYKMQKIITDILSLERIEAMQNGMEVERVELNTLVKDAAADFQPRALEKGLEFVVHAAEPLTVLGDAAQLREAVDNLIGNAIKYTPEGGKIDMRLRREDNMAVLEVEDTGYGIPDDKQEKLFEPFYRVQMDETQAIEGTGLGLHLVQNIITRHNGKIRFRSEHGVGSMFGFVMPLAH